MAYRFFLRRCAVRTRSFCVVALIIVVSTLQRMPLHAHVGEGSTSLIVACKLNESRRSQFQEALKSWLRVPEIRDIVIVDWFSLVDMQTILDFELRFWEKEMKLIKVNAERLEKGKSWRIGPAVNLALSFAQEENVLKVDCDTWLHPHFLRHNKLSDVGFRYGDYRKSRKGYNDLNLNGVFYAKLRDLSTVQGIDERLTLYGWDDSDLYVRLENVLIQNLSPLSAVYRDFVRAANGVNLIRHLTHERIAHENEELFGVCFNRIALQMWQIVPSWEKTDIRTRYKFRTMEDVRDRSNEWLKTIVVSITHEAPQIQAVIGRELCEHVASLCAVSFGLENSNVLPSVCSVSLMP